MLALGVRVFAAACASLGAAGCYHGIDGRDSAGGDGSADGGSESGTGEGGVDEQCLEPQTGLTSLRRLTATQYDNTIRDLLGVTGEFSVDFSPDERIGPFKSNAVAPVVELQVEHYMDAAETVAELAVADLAAILPCDPGAIGEAECAQQFIETMAPRAYRRPLAAGELDALMTVYTQARAGVAADFTTGIRVIVQGLLQSPYFLYHVEFGAAGEAGDGSDGSVVALTDHEVASRLSYFLWDSMPDDTLFAAADAGELATDEGLSAAVDRMLADPRAKDAVGAFHLQWLGVDEVEGLEKSAEYFPGFDAALAAAMKQETADFVSGVVLAGDGTLTTLLTADWTLTTDPALLALYGASLPADHQPGDPVPLDATQRAGLLTQGSVMAKHAHVNQTSPVHRGKLVRENLLCQILPPPPPNVDNVPPEPDPNATTRERFEQHRADPLCAGCHSLIDTIGFGFEHYDGIGAWRDNEAALPVDASGELISTDVDGPFDGAIELASRLASSEDVQKCVSKQWFRFAFGRAETEEDECSTDAVTTAFIGSELDVRELIREIVLSDSFRHRRGEPIAAAVGEEELR